MRFTIMAGELAGAVGWTVHALPKRASVPVLGGMLVEAGGDGVTLAAFDYDTSRRCTIELDAPLEDGRVLLPGRVLAELVKVLPKGEPVAVAVDGHEVVLRCGRSEFRLPLMPVDDFPSLPARPAVVGSVPTKTFAEAVGQAVVAAGTDQSTPMLTGVRFEAGDGLLHMAATDRYRMTWRTLPWTPALDVPDELAAVIPARILADVARGLQSHTSVQIGLSGGLASFACAGRETTVRQLGADFPKFRDHFVKGGDPSTVAVVDSAELAAAVKRVSLLAERSTPVRLAFDGDEVLVEAGGAESGRASEPVACKLDGDRAPFQIAFNPPFLAAGLGSFPAGPVEMRMTEPTRPCTLVRVGDDAYRHLVMPIRLS